jgi:agmatine deiminase
MPGVVGPARSDTKHKRLPASYANFYIGNGAVLAPVYSHANDKKAVRILQKCFPGRKIVPIECSALVYGLGSIHCVTQQQPR